MRLSRDGRLRVAGRLGARDRAGRTDHPAGEAPHRYRHRRALHDPPRGATDGPAALTIDEVRAALRPEVSPTSDSDGSASRGSSAATNRAAPTGAASSTMRWCPSWRSFERLGPRCDPEWPPVLGNDCWCLKADCRVWRSPSIQSRPESAPTGMARIDVGAWAVTKADNDEAARLADRVSPIPRFAASFVRGAPTCAASRARCPRFLESRGVRHTYRIPPNGSIRHPLPRKSPAMHSAPADPARSSSGAAGPDCSPSAAIPDR